ncbi:MAG: hypothetical protein DCC71_17200 [Proteobacteria bacterium]|nr:MAG: hypothetical protein DCC71_17200 [Pseudomonadota bacterium]
MTALCKSAESANDAIEALVEASFPSDDISVLMLEPGKVTPVHVEQKTGVPAGAAVGGALGTLAGLTAIAAFPGLLAAGPVIGLLQAAGVVGTGAGAGSLYGAYGGLGWWKTEADIPARELEEGAILVGVAVPDERCERAVRALERAGALRVEAHESDPA